MNCGVGVPVKGTLEGVVGGSISIFSIFLGVPPSSISIGVNGALTGVVGVYKAETLSKNVGADCGEVDGTIELFGVDKRANLR